MIRPLEYSNAPLQMLSSLADGIKQEKLLAERRYQEEFDQGLKLAQMISPEVLNRNFDAQVVNEGIGAVRNNLREFIKNNPNAGLGQIQSQVQKQIGTISDWSTKVKTIKYNLEETFKQIPQDKKVNKDRWMNAALTKALYKTNPDGTRTFRNSQELDPSFDYSTDVWNTSGEAFIDIPGVSGEIDNKIKNSSTNTETVKVSVGATKNKPGYTKMESLKIPTWARWNESENRVTVLKDANGVIDQDVYNQFTGGSNSEYDKFANIKVKSAFASGQTLGGVKAEDVFEKDGSIKDPTKFETAKKAWLTGYLEKFVPKTSNETTSTQPARMEVLINNSTTENDDNVMIDVVKNIKSYMQNNPRKKGMNWYPVTAFDDVSQDVIISEARRKTGLNSLGLAELQVQDFNGVPYIVPSKDITDPNDPTVVKYKAGQPLTPLSTKANMSANKSLGARAIRGVVTRDNKRDGASEL
jgi:hypothetical protein